jgi:hypothetical protein
MPVRYTLDPVGSGDGYHSHVSFLFWGIVLLILLPSTLLGGWMHMALRSAGANAGYPRGGLRGNDDGDK